MINNIKILFEKYNFDYIYINPKNIKDIDFEFIPEEVLADSKCPPNYLGCIKFDDKLVEVFWNPKVDVEDFKFKFRNIRNERKSKLDNLNDTID